MHGTQLAWHLDDAPSVVGSWGAANEAGLMPDAALVRMLWTIIHVVADRTRCTTVTYAVFSYARRT